MCISRQFGGLTLAFQFTYCVHNIYNVLWWWSGVVVSTLASINEVNQRRARLVLRWVTVSGFNSRCGTFISACDQPPRSTQPGHPFVGRRNEYQPKGCYALRLGSKGKFGSCKTVWNPCYLITPAISKRFRDKELIYKALHKLAVYCESNNMPPHNRSKL